MPELAANRRIPTMLFMLNNPIGSTDLARAWAKSEFCLVSRCGGTRDGHVIHYAMIAQQSTTVGELDGGRTQRLRNLARLHSASGFPTKILAIWTRGLGACLLCHCLSGVIYIAGGDCHRLSESNETAANAKGVREGFATVRALGLPVTPFPLKVLFTYLPQAFAIFYWRRFFAAKMADYVFGRHARAASQRCAN